MKGKAGQRRSKIQVAGKDYEHQDFCQVSAAWHGAAEHACTVNACSGIVPVAPHPCCRPLLVPPARPPAGVLGRWRPGVLRQLPRRLPPGLLGTQHGTGGGHASLGLPPARVRRLPAQGSGELAAGLGWAGG